MKWFVAIVVLVALLQIVLFVLGRKYRRKLKDSVIEKYNLKTPKDAWDAMGNPEIPADDREKIRKLYEAGDD